MAQDLVCQFRDKLNDSSKEIHLKFPKDVWVKIIEDDLFSPDIQCIKGGDIILIRFPSYSTPYSDKITTKVKNCTIVQGEIYDMNDHGKCYKSGDQFKIFPSDDIMPYTKENKALAVIELTK